MARELTGKHVLFIFVGAFTVIIGVNLVLAYSAVKTFPGLEAKNGFVESQQFDRDRALQEALGWTAEVDLVGEELQLSITDRSGKPVEVKELKAILGRPTHVREDQEPEFVFDGTQYVAPIDLSDGNWDLRMIAVAEDGTQFKQRLKMLIRKPGS
ncbi:FixH family protein [Rhodalgimonas zhirmunskyi]|uniref:FixH family protein n=1 Tax=Rhodalgimonas zhirmunskyi TaxID=2964767 RepID=A0AAJ1U6X6_9RHOB|nr:FixH family protein [Rhodoalgimonas zhirmunskyi]MDQ2094160.1 FixH family protein [Rhodoalgimonas zhirmunskyi]